ncbi:MAG: hypothetical protein IIZ39_13375 [Blautia sp.]|nr:hypothetical protein [Blautia sp.]
MDRRKLYLFLQSFLCVLLGGMMIYAVLGIYREGMAARADHPLAWVFEKERMARFLWPVLPVFLLEVVMALVGLLPGLKEEKRRLPKARLIKKEGYERAAKRGMVPWIFLVLAFVFLVLGVTNGSALDVFGKAVKICTECVGLG